MLVRIRMLTKGPNKNYKAKQIVTVDSERAAFLLSKKHAEEVTDGDNSRLQEFESVLRPVQHIRGD